MPLLRNKLTLGTCVVLVAALSGCYLDDVDRSLAQERASIADIEELQPFSAESAVQIAPLIEFPDTGVFTRIHPTKMAVGKDGKIYFNTSLAVVYRVDVNGVLEEVSVLPNAGGIPDDDFTIGITFDKRGDLYVSNVTGIYRISKKDLKPPMLAQPVPNTKIADIPAGLEFPMGLIADKKGNLYVADILGGAIYKVDIGTGQGAHFFSSPELLAPMVFPSNNLFGVGFGLTDLTIDTEGKYLYFGTQESHKIFRLGIQPDGTAGQLEELAHIPNLAFNGISFDKRSKTVFLSVPWVNFENGIQLPTNKVAISGSIWAINIRQLEKDGFATPSR